MTDWLELWCVIDLHKKRRHTRRKRSWESARRALHHTSCLCRLRWRWSMAWLVFASRYSSFSVKKGSNRKSLFLLTGWRINEETYTRKSTHIWVHFHFFLFSHFTKKRKDAKIAFHLWTSTRPSLWDEDVHDSYCGFRYTLFSSLSRVSSLPGWEKCSLHRAERYWYDFFERQLDIRTRRGWSPNDDRKEGNTTALPYRWKDVFAWVHSHFLPFHLTPPLLISVLHLWVSVGGVHLKTCLLTDSNGYSLFSSLHQRNWLRSTPPVSNIS